MEYKELWVAADAAGREAAVRHTPTPMVVQSVDMEGNVLEEYPPVMEGACGFAWVIIRPASKAGRKDCGLVQWLRAAGIGRFDEYEGGWVYWISLYNQSVERKERHAQAMADFLSKNGISASANSRLD